VQAVLQRVRARDPDQKEFLQACEEVLVTLEPVLTKYPQVRLVAAAAVSHVQQLSLMLPPKPSILQAESVPQSAYCCDIHGTWSLVFAAADSTPGQGKQQLHRADVTLTRTCCCCCCCLHAVHTRAGASL
jgi:hypothetical protein